MIVCLLGIGYMLLQTGKNARQVEQLQNQMTSMQSQLKKKKSEAIQSFQTIQATMNLHMAETSVEDAVRDILDKNFGQAESAIHSALDSIKNASTHGLSSSSLDKASTLLTQSLGQSRNMDQNTTHTLNEADRLIRKVIAGS
ncbi:MAG: hypothetical protein ACYCYP_06830 [Leptospirales bacterium]